MDILLLDCVKFRELFAENVLQLNEKRISCEVIISYNPNGSDKFYFYDENNNQITPKSMNQFQKITYKNDGDQLIKFHKRVNVIINPNATFNSIVVHCDYTKTYHLSNLKNIEEWNWNWCKYFFLEIK